MNFKGVKLYLSMLIAIVVVFLMNYLGSDADDRLYRALLNGLAGGIGLGISLWYMSRKNNDDHHQMD